MKSLQERFDSKWIPEPFSGCWLWTGALDSDGYARISVNKINRKAARIAWQLKNGSPGTLHVLQIWKPVSHTYQLSN